MHPRTLTSIYNLGMLLKAQGDLDGAAPLFQEELDASTTRFGVNHKETKGSAVNLAKLLQTMGRGQEAAVLATKYQIGGGRRR